MTSTKNARNWTVKCLVDWLNIREKEGKSFPATAGDLADEIDHSALFRRLVEGKDPMDNPPPLSFGNPWYQLMEEGEASPHEVLRSGNHVYIDGFSWAVIDELGPDSCIVTYGGEHLECKVWVDSEIEDEDGLIQKNWKIKKVH